MIADTTKRPGPETDLISLEQENEIRHWTESLRVSEESLRDAVRAVGNSAGKVRQYLSYAGSVI